MIGNINCAEDTVTLVSWSSAFSGSVPTNQSDVTLPADTDVLVAAADTSGLSFGQVTIPSTSSLVFANESTVFMASSIIVNGKLRIGSPSCPSTAGVRIVLTGRRGDGGSKSLEVRGTGQIDMHGEVYRPTWTRLARTADVNDTVLVL